jgi:hypothetical protein
MPRKDAEKCFFQRPFALIIIQYLCTHYLAKIKHRYGKHGRSLEPVEGIKGFFGPILYT